MKTDTPVSNILTATDREIYQLAELFSNLADPTRLKLLMSLYESERCVCELAEIAEVSPSAVSHQMKQLKLSGLVFCTRRGKHVFYRLADDHVEILLKMGLEHIRE